MNQELEQYLRMFIDHQQEQWPEWLGTAEFTYNNKVHTGTKVSPFQANNGQNPRIGFEMRKKGRFEKVGDLVLLSTKDLKWQMVSRRSENLTERFVEPYRIKKIISANAVELDLPSTIKIHPVVNMSRIRKYTSQVDGQRKEMPKRHRRRRGVGGRENIK